MNKNTILQFRGQNNKCRVIYKSSPTIFSRKLNVWIMEKPTGRTSETMSHNYIV